ncbi:carbonyl reductase [NADPH] 3-like [Cydia pomonella]|uniref:carbonyl reductase [NADPH] 3-like n=1 Tax=Cydia pomonella TaxID=82600 RepID=UPI002ADE1D84|nr:carbonyl reductase [NADPH] 3-like [Cydia pomonella]
MASKVAIVTGSNKGIGFGIVRGLCKRFQGNVYLTSRNEQRGKTAVRKLKEESLHPNYHKLDVTKKESLEVFRDYIQKQYGGIDVLINNAAIAFRKDSTMPAIVQAERTLFVNYFSLLSTCEILFPLLRKGARVINVSSNLGHLSQIPSSTLRNKLKDKNLTVEELSDLMTQYVDATRQGAQLLKWGKSSYAVSKVGVVALTRIQQRMLHDRDIKVNAVHPGYVATDMTAHAGPLTIDEGAQPALYLALDAPDSVRGEYVWSDNTVVDWEASEMPKHVKQNPVE